MSITEKLLRPLLASSAARPLITHYDDAAETRIELSVATVANWAAKTANWLVDEVDIEEGDAVAVRLPSHWQTAGVLLGAWWCGANVVSEPDEARIAFIGPRDEAMPVEATAIVALDPLGRGLAEQPTDAAIDYLNEARLAGDEFAPIFPTPGDTPALLGSTVDQVLAAAGSRAEILGISSGDRVLSTMDWSLGSGVIDGLLAPLSVGAHLVQVTNVDDTKLDERRKTERTTVDLIGE